MEQGIVGFILIFTWIISLLQFGISERINPIKQKYRALTLNIIISIAAGFFGIFYVLYFGNLNLIFFEYENLGFTLRLDPLSLGMYSMIGIVGFIVLRFSKNYLDGDAEHSTYLKRLAFTIVMVQLFVISGNLFILYLAWVATSMGLQKLLLLYPERKKAQVAAKKKFLIARLSDVSLLTALILLYLNLGTGNITEMIGIISRGNITDALVSFEWVGLFLILSACLKSVQIPFHGWLMEVMEAPTPISALLHAGLLNAGPFLIIRFAYVMDITTTVPMVLIGIGGVSALYGAVTSSLQASIKTKLAYSSIGHMGFSLMLSGFGVYSASLLHLVAHSFYKAYAFLSSGSIVERVQNNSVYQFERSQSIIKSALGICVAGSLFIGFLYLWNPMILEEQQLLIISGMIFLGILALQVNTFDSSANWISKAILTFGAILLVNSFFFFESGASLYLGDTIPALKPISSGVFGIGILFLILFGIVVGGQVFMLNASTNQFLRKMEIHFRNGLYLNEYTNRLLKVFHIK